MSIPGYDTTKVGTLNRQQKNLFGQSSQGVQSGLEGGYDYLSRLASGDPSIFEQIEAPAHTKFQQFLGDIGSRFSQFGGRNSSAFENAVSGAGAEMSENLASNRNNLMMQAIQSLMNQSNNLLNTKTFENISTPQNTGGTDWGQLIATVAPALLSMFGPGGALAGAGVSAATNAVKSANSGQSAFNASKSLPSFQYNIR